MDPEGASGHKNMQCTLHCQQESHKFVGGYPSSGGSGHWRGRGADASAFLFRGGADVARTCPEPPGGTGGAEWRGVAWSQVRFWSQVARSGAEWRGDLLFPLTQPSSPESDLIKSSLAWYTLDQPSAAQPSSAQVSAAHPWPSPVQRNAPSPVQPNPVSVFCHIPALSSQASPSPAWPSQDCPLLA